MRTCWFVSLRGVVFVLAVIGCAVESVDIMNETIQYRGRGPILGMFFGNGHCDGGVAYAKTVFQDVSRYRAMPNIGPLPLHTNQYNKNSIDCYIGISDLS